MEYKVVIPLRGVNFKNLTECSEDIDKIISWIDELVLWDPNAYMVGWVTEERMIIWFKEEKHAILCALKWA